MDRQEYTDYENSVRDFFEREGIENLSRVILPDGEEEGTCAGCGEAIHEEAFFSWRSCECCGRYLGGDRVHASGYNREKDVIYCYDICIDCEYYAEYSRLDDQTMMDIKENEPDAYLEGIMDRD